MKFNWFILTVGYSGLSPKAPGTAGSFVALILGVMILIGVGANTLFLAAMLATVVGIKAANEYEKLTHTHDDSRIVIDELAGMWFALSIAPSTILSSYNDLFTTAVIVQIVLSFIYFRIYDIKKPSIIGRIDRDVKGGIGVMGDDVIAGFAAGISSALTWHIYTLVSDYFI